ncbi:MAG: uracil-DNA glycosylase [Nitrosopumilus sp. H13]|nr:MAG: uracil-DNA glycosylase [Nitrosopumilus sp. H13]
MKSLKQTRQDVISCTRCELCKTRTNAVPGKGSSNADVVFVGEAPGRNEDERGEPFVGAAGRILSESLERAGISRDDVYITNVVKCRPPGNRVPKTEEREACSGYLAEELAAIRPSMVCVLGNTAFGSVLGGAEITKYRGKIARKDGQLYFITVHPAATIYNSGLVEVLDGDIARMFSLIRELKNGRDVPVDIEYS